MRRRTRRSSVVAVVVLAVACSGPSLTDEGFISLGRDNVDDGGVAGMGGLPGTGSLPGGGVFTTGGVDTGGVFTTGGTTAGTNITVGGTAGDSNGGTGTAGDGPSCGGAMPTAENAAGATLIEACGRVGPNQRVCLPDDYVAFCGVSPVVLEQCSPGTCANACCFATSDPCPPEAGGIYDCAGDCVGSCPRGAEPQVVPVTLAARDLQIVRVGASNGAETDCEGVRTRYFTLIVGVPALSPGARLMVSPPWKLSGGCPLPSDGQCIVINPTNLVVYVSTDEEAPPPRNVYIETDELVVLTCPPQY